MGQGPVEGESPDVGYGFGPEDDVTDDAADRRPDVAKLGISGALERRARRAERGFNRLR